MAHRSNVIQVLRDFEPKDPSEIVTDPVCGKQIPRRLSRVVLFRGDDTYYFCSKECQLKFTSPAYSRKRAS